MLKLVTVMVNEEEHSKGGRGAPIAVSLASATGHQSVESETTCYSKYSTRDLEAHRRPESICRCFVKAFGFVEH